MTASHASAKSQITRPWITLSASCLLVLVALLNVVQTEPAQWHARPTIDCDNGQSTHRFAEVNADRVNIRDLPTVFSTVLAQANRPDPVIVVCEFGVWSRIAQLDIAEETWISTGLITLTPAQPLPPQTRVFIVSMCIVGLIGVLIGLYRPRWVSRAQDLVMQTQDLPPHARPLISNPRASETPH